MLQQVFVDTEFTNFESAKLISIGLVTSCGEEFYAEAEYRLCECSNFVKEYVIPLLTVDEKSSLDNIRESLLCWIKSVGNNGMIFICYDSEYDREMIKQIFRNETPRSVLFRHLGPSCINGLKCYEFYINNKQNQHHALHDARALRYAFLGWLRKVR